VSLKVSIVLVLFGRVAAGERAVTVAGDGGAVPVNAVQRAAAMRLPAGPPIRVELAQVPGALRVTVGDRTRDVSIDGLSTDAATRLVALTVVDLVPDGELVVPALVASPRTFAIGLVGGAAGWDSPLAGGGVDLAVVQHDRLLAVELGGAALVGGPIQLAAATARLSIGMRFGIGELRGGLTLMPMTVGDGAGDRTVLVGAGASVRARIPIAAQLDLVFGVGADIFATRTTYRLGGTTALATPRVAPTFGAGVQWAIGRARTLPARAVVAEAAR
jgi:hypothetical protein